MWSPYLVSLLFAVLLSLHLVTFLMFFITLEVSWSIGKMHNIPATCPVSQGWILAEFNLVIFSRLPNLWIKKPCQIFLPYGMVVVQEIFAGYSGVWLLTPWHNPDRLWNWVIDPLNTFHGHLFLPDCVCVWVWCWIAPTVWKSGELTPASWRSH